MTREMFDDYFIVVQEYEKLSQFVSKYYNTTLEKKDLSVKGWNWGVADFKGW